MAVGKKETAKIKAPARYVLPDKIKIPKRIKRIPVYEGWGINLKMPDAIYFCITSCGLKTAHTKNLFGPKVKRERPISKKPAIARIIPKNDEKADGSNKSTAGIFRKNQKEKSQRKKTKK